MRHPRRSYQTTSTCVKTRTKPIFIDLLTASFFDYQFKPKHVAAIKSIKTGVVCVTD